jgi:hypothetical protein
MGRPTHAMPARFCMSALLPLFRPSHLNSGLGEIRAGRLCYMSAQAAVYILLNIPALTIQYIIYISHIKDILWYTRGYIPDKFHIKNAFPIFWVPGGVETGAFL